MQRKTDVFTKDREATEKQTTDKLNRDTSRQTNNKKTINRDTNRQTNENKTKKGAQTDRKTSTSETNKQTDKQPMDES